MVFNLPSWLYRKRVQAEVQLSGRPVQVHRVVNPFHAVAIVPGSQCCEAARQLDGTRFLSTEAPPLPLPHCGADACRCRYAHHSDRRVGNDRRNRDVWTPVVAQKAGDRRGSHGRRVTDQ